MGRHKKNDDTKYDIRIQVKLSKRENEMLEDLSKHFKLSKSYIIRHIIADRYIETWPEKR